VVWEEKKLPLIQIGNKWVLSTNNKLNHNIHKLYWRSETLHVMCVVYLWWGHIDKTIIILATVDFMISFKTNVTFRKIPWQKCKQCKHYENAPPQKKKKPLKMDTWEYLCWTFYTHRNYNTWLHLNKVTILIATSKTQWMNNLT